MASEQITGALTNEMKGKGCYFVWKYKRREREMGMREVQERREQERDQWKKRKRDGKIVRKQFDNTIGILYEVITFRELSKRERERGYMYKHAQTNQHTQLRSDKEASFHHASLNLYLFWNPLHWRNSLVKAAMDLSRCVQVFMDSYPRLERHRPTSGSGLCRT